MLSSATTTSGICCTAAKFMPSWNAPVLVAPSPIQAIATRGLPAHPRAHRDARGDRDRVAEHADRTDDHRLVGVGIGQVDDVDVEIAAARVGRPLGHVLPEDLERPDADGHQRAHVADERQHRVAALERVGGRDRLPFLAEAAIQAADHLALAEEDDEPLLDVARQPREVVHLEQLIPAGASEGRVALSEVVAMFTHVNRRSVRGVRRLADRLRHRRMRVDRADQLLDRAFEAQRQRGFGDELGRARADHVDAEHLVVLLVGDDLDEAFGLAGDLGAAEHAELEGADRDVVAALLRLGFGQADAADLRDRSRCSRARGRS